MELARDPSREIVNSDRRNSLHISEQYAYLIDAMERACLENELSGLDLRLIRDISAKLIPTENARRYKDGAETVKYHTGSDGQTLRTDHVQETRTTRLLKL